MREIKFRGKAIGSNKWIYGDLINYETGETSIFDEKISKYGYEATEITKRTKVDTETVGQWTGLKDKNGVEIYEGDITIHNNHDTKGQWIYSKKYCCFNMLEEDENNRFYFEIDSLYLEVIGNIHDNPELLEVK